MCEPLRGLTLGGARSTALREFNIGSHPAVQMVATVTDIATDACNGPVGVSHHGHHHGTPKVEGSVAFLISLRGGRERLTKPDVINSIVNTLRKPRLKRVASGRHNVRPVMNSRRRPLSGSSNSRLCASSCNGCEKSSGATSITLGYNGSPVIDKPSEAMCTRS